ncbi:MAG: ATP-binding protein, partial [Pseudomonadota bacterium]
KAFQELHRDFETKNNLRINQVIEFHHDDDFYQSGTINALLFGVDNVSATLNWVHINPETKILIASIHPYELSFSSEEDEQKQQQFSFGSFASLSSDAYIVCNTAGQILKSNETYQYWSEAEVGRNLYDFIPDNDRARFSSLLQNLSGAAQTACTSFVFQGQRMITVQWTAKKEDDLIYIVGRDISEREKYKKELAMHQQRLDEAEALGHIGQWEWIVGKDDIYFSKQLNHIFGFRTQKPRNLDMINSMIHPDDSDRMMQIFQRAIIEQKNYDMDFRINADDGVERHIRCEGRCKIDDSGDVYALYGIMQDVTQAMIHETSLVQAKESAEKAYASKTQFLANMSHELRTPLNAVIGFSEMMERQLLGPIGNDKYLEYISGIRKSGEHLLSLIGDILDMSKIEAGKYELSLEKFNIAKTAQLAAHMVEGRAAHNNIEIEIDIPDDKIQITADRRAVMQIILNILSNAVKFSHENGKVILSIQKNENFVFITIKDNGIGIPANKLATITEPFEQAQHHLTRDHEGTGLGLSITKELIEIHNGTLKILSEVDVGTEVIVRLPKEQKN